MSARAGGLEAAERGDFQTLRDLLESDKSQVLEARSRKSLTPLHLAALRGRTECVRLLLQAGAATRARTGDLRTALHLASRVEIATLIAGGDAIEPERKIYVAAATGDAVSLAELLAAPGAAMQRDECGYTPAHFAAHSGSHACLELLLSGGANLEAKTRSGCTPLHLAASNGHDKCVEVLLRAHADKDAQESDGETPLYTAAQNGHEKCAILLLGVGANVNLTTGMDGRRCMSLRSMRTRIAQSCCCSMEQISMQETKAAGHLCTWPMRAASSSCSLRGANANEKIEHGWTPLHVASQLGKAACVRLLLEAGAQRETTTDDGRRALHIATEFGHSECVDYLLRAGANKDARQENNG
jgi:ankyrin repeat protein